MFLGIIFLAIGLALLLQAMGILTGSMWTVFWGIVFLAAGLKMMAKKNHCVHCDWMGFKNDRDQTK